MGRRAVNAKQDERRLPGRAAGQRILGLRPDVRVAVLRGRHDAVRVRRPVDGRDDLVMLQPDM